MFRRGQAAKQNRAHQSFVSTFVTELFNCDPVSPGKSLQWVWGTDFSAGYGRESELLGSALESLPGGEHQRRHRHNKSRLLRGAGQKAGFEAFPLEHACLFLLPIL